MLAFLAPGLYQPPQIPQENAEMARVTVEDCVDKVENRFELVLLAATARA